MYTHDMKESLKNILMFRDQVLKALAGKLEGFFLAGGTALSLFYYQHRESFDLDFFTKDFSKERIMDIIAEISKSTATKIDLIKERKLTQEDAKMIVCYVPVEKNKTLPTAEDNEKTLKVDFVQDVYRDIRTEKNIVNGIPVMVRENIYLRKIFAAFGYVKVEGEIGEEIFLGGRQEAKDIFDLYYLSTTFLPLSKFMDKYCNLDERAGAITWHKRHDRLALKSELLDIITDVEVDCRVIEKHFDSEIESIINQMAG